MLSYRICCRAHPFKELKCSFISYFSGGAVATTPWHEQVAKHVPCRKQHVGHCCHSGWPTAAVKKTTVVIGSLWDHINTYLYRKVRRSSMSLIRLTVVSLDSLSCVLHCVLGALQLWHSSNPTLTPFFQPCTCVCCEVIFFIGLANHMLQQIRLHWAPEVAEWARDPRTGWRRDMRPSAGQQPGSISLHEYHYHTVHSIILCCHSLKGDHRHCPRD